MDLDWHYHSIVNAEEDEDERTRSTSIGLLL